MDARKCPACGEGYDGRVCRSCGYSQFQEERKLPKWVISAVLAAVLVLGGVLAYPRVTEALAPQPEPLADLPLPEGTVLFSGDGVSITAGWQDGQLFGEGVPITLTNGTEETVCASFKEIVANGYVMETSLFQLSAGPGERVTEVFSLHETDLSNTGIEAVTDVSFHLTAFHSPSYVPIAKTDRITLKGAIPPGYIQSVESDGAVLYDQDGVKIVFRSYRPGEEAPEDFTKGKFLFYIQNSTHRHLRISMPEVLVNGEMLDIGIWSELMPDTKAVTAMYLYRLKDLGIENPQQLQSLSYNLEITDMDDNSFHILTEPYILNMGQ